MLKNVISYALFGEDPRYWGSVRGVVWAHHHLFPGWELRVYHDHCLPKLGQLLLKYRRAGLVTLVNEGATPPFVKGSLWRFKPIWDPSVNYVLTRDIDSLPMVRDRLVSDEFLAVKLAAHAVSDHPEHDWKLLCGLAGFWAPVVQKLLNLASWDALVSLCERASLDFDTKRHDQELWKLLWPRFETQTIEHRLNASVPFYGSGLKLRSVPRVRLPDVPDTVQQHFDQFSPFLGHVSFNVHDVVTFLAKHGNPDTTKRLMQAEEA
jgi:hypothetical protein